jgi:hypothetical protein
MVAKDTVAIVMIYLVNSVSMKTRIKRGMAGMAAAK